MIYLCLNLQFYTLLFAHAVCPMFFWIEFCFVFNADVFPHCHLGDYAFFIILHVFILEITLCIIGLFEYNINYYFYHVPAVQGSQIQFLCFLPFLLF